MMKRLWTFGDSFTYGHGCRADGPLKDYYFGYKKNMDDIIWPEILARNLNCDLINLGKCGASNDYILNSMMEVYEKINEDDIVILNKTFHHRFDVPQRNINQLVSVTAEITNKYRDRLNELLNKYALSNEELETIINFSHFFSGNELYKERQDIRFDFMKSIIKCEKYFEITTTEIMKMKFETIKEDTNGKIVDLHLSFNGHKQFANYVYNKLYPKVI